MTASTGFGYTTHRPLVTDVIERSVALFNDSDLDDLDGYLGAGFTHFIWGVGGPDYDLSGVERLLRWRASLTGSR